MGSVGTWLVSLASPFIRRVLLSLGIGLISYSSFSSVLESLLSQAKSSFNSLPGQLMGLVGLMGGGEIMSIIAGAMVARVSLAAAKKFGIL